jgi:hypothetical protein
MAESKRSTATQTKVNNSCVTSTIAAKDIELVVVNSQLVPDFRVANPGVIITGAGK